MTISLVSYFVYGVQPVHFGLNMRVEYQTRQPTSLCGHGSCVPGHDCLHTSLRTVHGHAWTVPETTFSSSCPSMKQLSGLWDQVCEGLCPGPSVWKHPWMMRGDKLSENFCLFGGEHLGFLVVVFLILSSLLNAPSQPPHIPTTQNICDMCEHVHGRPPDVWWMGEQTNANISLIWFSGYCPESMSERGIKSQFNILNVETLVKRVVSWMSAFLLQLETQNWTPNGYLAMSVFHATCFHSNKTVV